MLFFCGTLIKVVTSSFNKFDCSPCLLLLLFLFLCYSLKLQDSTTTAISTNKYTIINLNHRQVCVFLSVRIATKPYISYHHSSASLPLRELSWRLIINQFMNEQQDLSKRPKTRAKRSKYNKISLKSKLIFFQKVIHQQGDLREIAKLLNIKYSTAKTLVRNYKRLPEEADENLIRTVCQDFECKFKARGRCSYLCLEESTQAGDSSVKQQWPGCVRPFDQLRAEMICSQPNLCPQYFQRRAQ